MTDNHNMNKTTMKDVQLQHFLFKRASRMSEMFPKTLFSVNKSRSKTFGNYPYFLPATTTTGYPIRPFSFHLQPEINLSLYIFLKALRETFDIVLLSQIFSTCHDMK